MVVNSRACLLATVGLFFGGSASVLAAPSPANAACHEFAGYYQLSPTLPVGTWGKGVPNSNTCDGDDKFYGQVLDAVTDGSCVWAQFEDNAIIYSAGVSCTTGGWGNFGYHDQTGTNVSRSRVKRNATSQTVGPINGAWKTQSGY
jgi:hypothetical protein